MLWLVAPSLIAGYQGSIGWFGGENSTKVLGTNPSHWKLICSEFSDAFEEPGTPHERVIKHEIDLLADSIPRDKR